MSFTYGGVSTDSMPGVTATLESWPSLSGLQLETIEAPGTDGMFLGGVTRSKTRFVFDVILHAAAPADVFALRDQLTGVIDPARGEKTLLIEAAAGWCWRAICAAEIDWQRLTWDTDLGFRLRGNVAFDVLDGYARPTVDESWTRTGAGAVTVKRSKGNAVAYPTIEIKGTLTAAQTVTVTAGTWKVTVQGPLTSTQVLRLNFDTFEFAIWSGTTKVASVVRRMSMLDRLEVWPGQSVSVSVAATGTVSSMTVFANARNQ